MSKTKDNKKVIGKTLAKEVGLGELRIHTIRWYSDLGILPSYQRAVGLRRYYDLGEASSRLEEIKRLKGEGKTIADIMRHYRIPDEEIKAKLRLR